jgi:Tol biopolymer transport system component
MRLMITTLLVCASTTLHAQTTEIVSVSSTGGAVGCDCFGATISADGSRVSYTSNAADIVPGHGGFGHQIFVRDLASGLNLIASVNASGVGGDYVSQHSCMSADGRVVAFASYATDLVSGDTNSTSDIFVRDLLAGTTERVSVDASGAEAVLPSDWPAISADGRFVAFASRSAMLAPGDANGDVGYGWDVFLKDRTTGAVERISVSSAGAGGNNDSSTEIRGVALTPDARFVAFSSLSTNLVPGDTNNTSDIFLRDRQLGTTTRVSVATGGGQVSAAPSFGSYGVSLSDDGRFVAFSSGSNSFTPLDTTLGFDIFVHDTLLNVTTFESEALPGGPFDRSSYYPSISADGRFVAFQNGGGSNELWEVWIRDRQTATVERVSVTTEGELGDDDSSYPSLSADGTRVTFASNANNFPPPTTAVNPRVFLRTRAPVSQYDSYCFGDGTGSACPCGNASVLGHQEGCLHSFGTGGKLTAQGNADAALDTFVLVASGVPSSTGLFFQGTTRIAGGNGAVFGDGLRCAGGASARLGQKTASGGIARYPESGDVPISVQGGIQAGDTRTYQYWYRNTAAFCTPAGFNLTNAIEATW